jgi:hypothetical protein
MMREIITKDCIEIWQRATIRDALPEEYKEKAKQEAGRMGNESRYGSGSEEATEFADQGESSNISRDSNLAESGSVGPVEDVSEDLSQMNRGPDVLTESERIRRQETPLAKLEAEGTLNFDQ